MTQRFASLHPQSSCVRDPWLPHLHEGEGSATLLEKALRRLATPRRQSRRFAREKILERGIPIAQAPLDRAREGMILPPSTRRLSWETVERNIQAVRPGMHVLGTSARTGTGMPEYIAFLEARLDESRTSVS